jgi:hypothetical protein
MSHLMAYKKIHSKISTNALQYTQQKTKLQFSNTKRKQVFYEDDQTLSKNVEFVENSAVFRPRNSSN